MVLLVLFFGALIVFVLLGLAWAIVEESVHRSGRARRAVPRGDQEVSGPH